MPDRWERGATHGIRNAVLSGRRAGSKRRNHDLHRLTGIASVALLLLVTITGIWFVFPEPFRAFAEFSTQSTSHEDSPVSDPANRHLPRISIDDVLLAANAVLPTTAPNWVGLPADSSDVFSVRKRLPGEWRLDGGAIGRLALRGVRPAHLHRKLKPSPRLGS